MGTHKNPGEPREPPRWKMDVQLCQKAIQILAMRIYENCFHCYAVAISVPLDQDSEG